MNSSALDLDNLNPDLNGDGVVEDWENKIYTQYAALPLTLRILRV